MATVLELYPSDALLWLEFGGIYTDSAGNKVIDNLATRGDAPARVTCGASTACPTQLSGRRGVRFAGAQWIDTGVIGSFDRTNAFTLFILHTFPTTALQMLCTNIDAATALKGVQLYSNVTTMNTEILGSISPAYYLAKSFPSNAGIVSSCMTYSGSSTAAGMLFYSNGAAVAGTTAKDTLSVAANTGLSFLLGARRNGAAKAYQFVGNMHFAAIFPLAASALQIQNLHKRVLRRINLP